MQYFWAPYYCSKEIYIILKKPSTHCVVIIGFVLKIQYRFSPFFEQSSKLAQYITSCEYHILTF